MDWLRASAAEQGRAIMAGLISPLEQTEAYLDAALRHPYGERIYARMTPERARKESVAAHDRARTGRRRGLLDGVALSWKDNFDTAGVATEAGSRLLEGRIPTEDARVLANATGEGLICLGKTHLTELAFSGLGLNPMTATPPNAYDAALAPGGSSSGAAVSVALGLAAAAIGSDTGGSIRLPAAWNGLVGFKPTHGAISGQGIVPLCLRFDTAGPIARTVEDCALLFSALTQTAAVDLSETPNRKLRVLVLEGLPFDEAREAPVAAFEDAIHRLGKAGAQITRATLPVVTEIMQNAATAFAPEAYGIWRDQIEAAPELMYPPILARFRGGKDVLATDYVAAWIKIDELRAAYAEAVAGYDVVALPTSPILPPDVALLLADPEYFARENLLALRNTRIGNFLGLPAISLPTGHPGCGLMLMGHARRDRALLVSAAGAEAALAV
ncbi:amidase [Paracoccus aminophilus]|uniref:Aspartyl-tRNA(Asn)/glutamyl-tRNA (Gln) amidotransferase, subunit A n=1 Tax=Paracoccus aminophilus JCM 7686 TaxID=1367847 RepID=S5Y7U2_PARAH|nr:amidase [Paracoccus aminophilus]AGT07418.1 aspartyl-tRNA(Asn)/glutamyl-tRNA (Gln) amidotransferase, subunit A [Paracoccus aminophilus JCM 7686]